MAIDPLRNFKFTVDIAGFPGSALGFSKVSGLSSEVEVIEYREGGDTTTNRKFPGQVSFGNVTLERGVTTDSDLVDWLNSIFDPSLGPDQAGDIERFDVTITVKSKQGTIQRQFKLLEAFPASREITDLDAGSNEILIESLELAHQGLVEVKYDAAGTAR
jgi:phage tail-like protein